MMTTNESEKTGCSQTGRPSSLFGIGGLFLAAALFFVVGCASPQMKGTPFYTGEYHERRGPAEERVNLWPLLYYREPALSVLWPFMEKTDDHFAVRPLMSVYGLEKKKRTYNVLWPIAQFDQESGDNRVFPVFWGEDYRIVFPLYWHYGAPFGGGHGYDALFPLWSYSKDQRGYSAYFPWPFVRVKNRTREKGWHVWPIAGHYTDTHSGHESSYGFYAWPLGHRWKQDGRERGDMLFPLYYRDVEGDKTRFISLPLSFGREGERSHWECVMPFYFHRRVNDEKHDIRTVGTLLGGYHREGDQRSWVAAPLLSGGTVSEHGGSFWAAGPLAHGRWSKNSVRHHVFPLYYRSVGPEGSRFVSLPWSCGKAADGSSWQLVPPLFAHSRDAKGGSRLITPLYAKGESGDGARRWHAVLPFYYLGRSPEGRSFVTALGGARWDKEGRRWLAYPLLSWGTRHKDGGEVWALAPLVHAKWDAQGRSHHVLPFYYWDGRDKTFLSPLVAQWQNREGGKTIVVPPALSWANVSDQTRDLWLLGGLVRTGWGTDPSPRHVIPFYYSNPKTGTLVSPLVAKWQEGERKHTVWPPLLSGYVRDGQDKEVWAALGLFHKEWGPTRQGEGHMFPLYAYRSDEFFVTPLFGKNSTRENGFVYPLTPLAGAWKGDYSGGWLFPLWSHRREREAKDYEGRFLWGRYWRKGRRSGSGLFPLYSYKNHGVPETSAAKGPYGERSGKDFWCLPICWYERGSRAYGDSTSQTGRHTKSEWKRHGCFPLWHHSSTRRKELGRTDASGAVLLALYDYKREVRGGTKTTRDYTRRRILWRLWHYERLNGDVSVDVFPGITWDLKKDGYKKFSFLWRFLRYERGPKGKKVDVLFLPIVRAAE